ncbi:MAG: hypothetical protein CSB02_00985, partial [Bacteroidia bacterium]
MKILITGASRGIGLFLLQRFKEQGHQVYGTYSATQPNQDLLAHFTQVDVANTADVEQWIDNAVSNEDDIVLINCAGINYTSLARRADVEDWMHVIDVNLGGTFRAIQAVLPKMYKKGFG